VITDYTSLQAAIADYLGRSDLTTQIQTFINQGESRIYRNLRVADMEKTVTLTITSGTAAVPADYLAMRELYLLDSNGLPYQPVERVTPFYLHQQFNAQNNIGQPAYFAREGTNFIFAPLQGDFTTASGIYWARLPALSGANTTNWLTTKNPDLIMGAALLEAATYLADDAAVQYWTARYGQCVQDVQSVDDDERMSGSPPVMRRG
jgi:hypothetical protein